MMQAPVNSLEQKLIQQLSFIYKDCSLEQSYDEIAQSLIDIMRLSNDFTIAEPFTNHWSEKDVILITYGDSVIEEDKGPRT